MRALAFSLALVACSSSPVLPDAGNETDASVAVDAHEADATIDVTTEPPPPFHCDPASATSPVLAGTFLFDPADPHPGDTITVLVKSANFKQPNEPKMTLEATSATGLDTEDVTITAGGSGIIYYYAVPNVPLGDVCLLTRINGNPELAGKITVTPRPAPPPSAQGVYKVKSNHQFTCQEEVPWGNEFHVAVLDAQGNGVPGAVVDVRLPDSTDLGSIKNSGTHPVPTTLTMDSTGHYDDYYWWPSNGNGYTVFELSVHGEASDVATEISSGWWETDETGCRYCDPSQPINVYGHWSHRIVFQLDASATEACVVPSDHAGMSACPNHGHAYHHPTHEACFSVK